MAEYLDRDAVLDCFHDWIGKHGEVHTADEMSEFRAIEALGPADVAPVVRCRDCKYYSISEGYAFGLPVKQCSVTGFEDCDDDDFCSRGERREK